MNQGFTPGVFLALALVAGLIAGSYWLARPRQGPGSRREASSKTHRTTPRTNFPASLSALQAKASATQLLASGAGWPKIIAAMNPQNDANIHAELQRIRGPHMFAPATALQVIHHGCEEALRANKHASALAAVTAARVSMEKVTRYGD